MFVYGTLMPGRLRWPLLARFAVDHRPAVVAGRLYDSGRGWPMAVFVGDGSTPERVPGHVVDLDPTTLGECLVVIDEVEQTETDELRRVEVTTAAGEPAWAYHFTQSAQGLAQIASWSDIPLDHER